MTQLNRILAATDLSTPAGHATARAALVSKETGAALDLVHVANLAPLERLRQLMDATPAEMQQQVLDAARRKMLELADGLRREYGVSAGTQVASGSLLAELARQAQGTAVDLLVCGARGESVIRHSLLGTTAVRLLKTASYPVLVVRQAPRAPYRRVLVAVDFSAASPRAVRHAQQVAPGADLVLVHAFEVPFEGYLRYASVDEAAISHYRIVTEKEALQKLAALRDEAGLTAATATLLVLHGDPRLRIVEQEEDLDCDLVVMGKHGDSALETLLLGSVTRHVLAAAQGDVLVSMGP
jgi:nucleotide-binding universal stress UspA family protein